MSLTILSVAYPLAAVGRDAVGGAEQILSQIDRALVQAGHRSLVIACDGSRPSGEFISTGALPDRITEDVQEAARGRTLDTIKAVLKDFEVDLIHLHGLDFGHYLPETDIPILATLHLPPSWYPSEIFANTNLLLHCVSASQRAACPPNAKLLPDIPNGVEVPRDLPSHKEPFVLALGRICPEKGFHLAAQAARLAGVRFVLAGEVFAYPAHQEYFDRELQSRLQGNASFIGPVFGECKQRLLASARCVLIPSLVDETSSLVALEAMAAGTPVIAFPSGALAGLVRNGENGFLVKNVIEMAEAIGRADQIPPADCRRYVAENFSLDRMTNRYLDLYAALTAVPRVNCAPVSVQLIRDREGLAELIPEWRALFHSCSTATPFQSPDWAQPWWECFGSGVIATIAVRGGGELVGLAPLYIRERTVRFLGAAISDYGDVLAAHGWERRVAESVMDALGSLESEWDICDFDELRQSSPLLLARTPGRYSLTLQDASVCPWMQLSGLVLSAKQRRSVSNSRHRLEREFPEARFETVGEDGAAFFTEAFIRLHEARWSPRNGCGVIADEAVQNFHRAAIPRLQRERVARLYTLRSGERILSTLYCLAHQKTLYYYLGGFDPSIERVGPGSLLIDHAIEQARAEGIESIDFLRGTEAYKYLWGAVDRSNRRLLIHNA